MSSGPYKTKPDVKVPFIMPEFSNRYIMTHFFHVENTQGDAGNCYYKIIGLGLMIQLGLKADFGCKKTRMV